MKITDTIKFLESSGEIEAQLHALQELKASVTYQDLPRLLDALTSKTSNFVSRELIAEPIIDLGGVRALPQLMTALRMNFEEGHDNDTLQALLADLAEADPEGVRAELERIAKNADKTVLEDIKWLLEFCQA